jgi:hypothetical protein
VIPLSGWFGAESSGAVKPFQIITLFGCNKRPPYSSQPANPISDHPIMKTTILGAVLVIWGAAALIIHAAGGTPNRGGAYGAGQSAGLVFAAIMIVVGAWALRKGLRERQR